MKVVEKKSLSLTKKEAQTLSKAYDILFELNQLLWCNGDNWIYDRDNLSNKAEQCMTQMSQFMGTVIGEDAWCHQNFDKLEDDSNGKKET